MIYTLIKNSQSYDLPPYTAKVNDAIEKVNVQMANPNIKITEKYNSVIDFIVSEIGEDNAKEIIGTLDASEIDLQETYLCFLDIVKAYDRPMRNAQNEEMKEKMDSAELDKILDILKNADKIESLQKLAQRNASAKANFRNMQR